MTRPHWHEHNPWKDELFYISIEDAISLLPSGDRGPIGRYVREYGDKLDAYLLPSGSMGIRYGDKEHEYLSPFVHPRDIITWLMNKCRELAPKVAVMLPALQIAEEQYENFAGAGKDDGTLAVIRSAIMEAKAQ